MTVTMATARLANIERHASANAKRQARWVKSACFEYALFAIEITFADHPSINCKRQQHWKADHDLIALTITRVAVSSSESIAHEAC